MSRTNMERTAPDRLEASSQIRHTRRGGSSTIDDTITWDQVEELWGELTTVARELLKREYYPGASPSTIALLLTAIRRQVRGIQRAAHKGEEQPRRRAFLLEDGIDWSAITWRNRDEFFQRMYRSMQCALLDNGAARNAQYQRNTVSFDALQELHPGKESLPCANGESEMLHRADPTEIVEIDQTLERMDNINKLVGGTLDIEGFKSTMLRAPEVMETLFEALAALAKHDAKQAMLFEHHLFSGLTLKEISRLTDVPYGTVRAKLRAASAFVHAHLSNAEN